MGNWFWSSVGPSPVVLIIVMHLVRHLLVSRISHHSHFVCKGVFVFFTLAAGACVVTHVLRVVWIGRGMLMVVFQVATCVTYVLGVNRGMVLTFLVWSTGLWPCIVAIIV